MIVIVLTLVSFAGLMLWLSLEDDHDRGCDCGECRDRILRKMKR